MKTRPPESGYTLVEVIVAGALLMIGVAAAAVLALATVTQEETNARITRCVNLHEQAVRLYQLGLDPAVAAALLPADPAVTDLTFTTGSSGISGLGTVEFATSVLTYSTTPLDTEWSAGTWTGGERSSDAQRTSTILAIRPSIR